MIDLILVGAPTTLFALKIQVDMGKDVAPHDYPRQAVVAIGWFEIFGYYFEALLPFVPGKAFGPQGELVKKYILISKHAAINVANAIKNNIMIGYHIVGMLSSSFQPKDAVEETPTTVAQL